MLKPFIVSIVGQTATGKTDLALSLADQLLAQGRKRIDILSADSRQVYKELPILSGADIPEDFQKKALNDVSHFENVGGTLSLHGVACISAKDEWSAGHFRNLFLALLDLQSPDTALIVVGGTGLYHQQIFQPAETLGTKPNPALRKRLEKLELEALQKELQSSWPERWEVMNHSDRQNPRRLIRAIEITHAEPTTSAQAPTIKPTRQIGLTLPPETLREKIKARIEQRWAGALEEVQKLENTFPEKPLPAKTILGYEQLRQHLFENLPAEEAKQLWLTAELQYAKRQHTWWKKRPGIEWFDSKETSATLLFP